MITNKATRLRSETLYRVIAVLLVAIAAVLLAGHDATTGQTLLTGVAQAVAGIVAGFVIGVVASLLGVAGGELLIPTLILLFGADIKLAGSLSLAVSLPTMLVGFTRYSRDQGFPVLGRNCTFMLVMAAGSIVGAFHAVGISSPSSTSPRGAQSSPHVGSSTCLPLPATKPL